MAKLDADILVVGGGLGGVAAALAAARLGRSVILTEPTDWLGGQLTAQGVPPDEHRWIEQTGCTRSYRRLRNGIRQYYRDHYPLLPQSRHEPALNPGMGFVSRLCGEPKVAVAVIEQMLAPFVSAGTIQVLLEHDLVAAQVDNDAVEDVTFVHTRTGAQRNLRAAYVLDATELGDLLEATGAESRTGAESQAQTGELHALPGEPDPTDQQAITFCYALDYREGEDHTIPEPDGYEFWRDYQADFWPGPNLSWWVTEAITGQPLHRPLFAGAPEAAVIHDLWHFRRILWRGHYPEGTFASDITLVNWAAIDYWLKPLVGVNAEQRTQALTEAQNLSLAMLHWMQTQAPRHDGGTGYPGLRLRPDVMGTSNGLAKHAYVRESRRALTEFTVTEQHIGVEARENVAGAERFWDSVGIGAYRIDLHPSTAGRGYVDVNSWPFQIPLGALIPVRMKNLLPAAKNIGTTHITNGAYRLHPVEWNIGEAAGALVAYCLARGVQPAQVRADEGLLQQFQGMLVQVFGVELSWPEYSFLGPETRYGSPSAIFGGDWLAGEGSELRVAQADDA